MKKLMKFLAVALIAAFVFTGCGKYEEGPSFSLLTKTSRLTGTWKLTHINSTAFNDVTEMTYEKDGSYSSTSTILMITTTSTGTWTFSESKESILTTSDNTGITTTNKILRLTKDEYWLESSTGDVYKYEKQ